MGEDVLREAVEEVGLVFRGVPRAAQLEDGRFPGVPRAARHARVVAGGEVVATELPGMLQERSELDAAVADRARVGGEPRLVGADEGLDHVVLEARAAVDDGERDAQALGHGARVLDVGAVPAGAGGAGTTGESCPRRAGARILAVVQPHGRAQARIALLLEQPCRDARIDAAAHRDEHAPAFMSHGVPFP